MNNNSPENGMSATDWIALGGLVIATLTCYFSFCTHNPPNPTTVIEVKPTLTQNVNVDGPVSTNSVSNKTLPIPNPIKSKPPGSKSIKPKIENEQNEVTGLLIKIIDASTKGKPVEGVSISFSGFPDVLTSNQNGDFIIPKNIILKRGEFNSVRAYFTRNGFESVDYEIGLSETHIYKIKKSE